MIIPTRRWGKVAPFAPCNPKFRPTATWYHPPQLSFS
jgi:hypothetical protein